MNGYSIELISIITFYQIIGKYRKTLVGLRFSRNVGVEEGSLMRIPFGYGFVKTTA